MKAELGQSHEYRRGNPSAEWCLPGACTALHCHSRWRDLAFGTVDGNAAAHAQDAEWSCPAGESGRQPCDAFADHPCSPCPCRAHGVKPATSISGAQTTPPCSFPPKTEGEFWNSPPAGRTAHVRPPMLVRPSPPRFDETQTSCGDRQRKAAGSPKVDTKMVVRLLQVQARRSNAMPGRTHDGGQTKRQVPHHRHTLHGVHLAAQCRLSLGACRRPVQSQVFGVGTRHSANVAGIADDHLSTCRRIALSSPVTRRD